MKVSCIYVRCGLPDFLKIAFSSKEQSWFLYLELTVYFLPSLFLSGARPGLLPPPQPLGREEAC